jgi:hypothetical protein
MSSMTGGRIRPNGLDRSAATIASALNPFFMKDRRLIQRFRPFCRSVIGISFRPDASRHSSGRQSDA